MLLLISDIHSYQQSLHQALLAASPPFVRLDRPDTNTPDATLIVQLGDISIGPKVKTRHFYDPPTLSAPVHFLRGNHDYEPNLQNILSPKELYPNILFLPDATIINFRGRRIGILGGGDSVIDRPFRVEGVDWWPSEKVSVQAAEAILPQGPIDLLLTHMPPASLITNCLDYPPSESAIILESLWQKLGNPPLFCGHVHDRVSYKNATVIEFGQAVILDLKDLSVRPV